MNNTNQPSQPNKPREHVFSPHTDLCVHCGQSAQHDAIENTPCGSDQPGPCQPCNGKGWYLFNTGNDQAPRYEVQRCDVCEQFDSDLTALQAVEKAALAHPALLKFVEKIAGLKQEGEPDDDGPFEPTAEDSMPTLNQLIVEAQELVGTAEKCDRCGETVPYVIGCSGGAELCQDCFDTGEH